MISFWITSSIVFPFTFKSSLCCDNIYTNLLWGPSEHKCIFETWKYEWLRGGSWTDITLENVENCCRANWTWPDIPLQLPYCTYLPPPCSQFHAVMVELYQGHKDDSERGNWGVRQSWLKIFGIMIGNLGRKGNPGVLVQVWYLLSRNGKDSFVLLLSKIFPRRISLFPGVVVWVQVAFPCLSVIRFSIHFNFMLWWGRIHWGGRCVYHGLLSEGWWKMDQLSWQK